MASSRATVQSPAAYDTQNLTRAKLRKRLRPLIQGEIDASVTPPTDDDYGHETDLVYDAHRMGLAGDGDGAGGGADDSPAFADALAVVKETGGTLALHGRNCYRLDAALELLNDTDSKKHFTIDGNGAVLDFSASGLTSGSLLSVGGETISDISENGSFTLRNFSLIGPETGSAKTDTADGTTCGLNLQYALNVFLRNIKVRNCWAGITSRFVFPLDASGVILRNSYVPLHLRGASNDQIWTNLQCLDSKFGPVLEYSDGNKIIGITFQRPRIENAAAGFVMDPTAAGIETIADIHILNPYLSTVTYDCLRAGRAWDSADASARGADRSGSVMGLHLNGGNWAGGGWTSTHAALCFAAATGVRGLDATLPVEDSSNAVVGAVLGGVIRFISDRHTPAYLYKPVHYDNNGNRVHVERWAVVSPTQLTAQTDNWSVHADFGKSKMVRFSTDASRDITGIDASGIEDGAVFAFSNTGTNGAVLKHESASSSEANRFSIGSDYTVAAGRGFEIWRDGSSSRWRLKGV